MKSRVGAGSPTAPRGPGAAPPDRVQVEEDEQRRAEAEGEAAAPPREGDDRDRGQPDQRQAADRERVGGVAEEPVHRGEQVVVGGAEVGDAEAVDRSEQLAAVLRLDHRLLQEGGAPPVTTVG